MQNMDPLPLDMSSFEEREKILCDRNNLITLAQHGKFQPLIILTDHFTKEKVFFSQYIFNGIAIDILKPEDKFYIVHPTFG